MSSSSNYLFLLFLLLVVLLAALLLLKLVIGARAPIHPPALTPTHEELPPTTMRGTMIPSRDANDRWKALLDESETTIEQYLVPKIDIDLASFVRCITFRVFLVVFLDVDPNRLVVPNLQLVTAALSEFYDDGQRTRTLPPEVQNILYGWLPHEQFPSSLDRILPAYEALWRIVATLVVTCEDDETKVLRWVMLDFRDNPRDRQYTASFGGDGRSVSAITDNAVGRITPVARPPHATTSTWPLSCMQYASASNSVGYPPTVHEALKFAALLASMIIGRIGVQYGISGNGITGSQASPWDQRRIFGVNRTPSINVELRPHASRQEM